MPSFDPTLFSDVADALGISSPVLVEKDYYAVQLLNIINNLSFDGYQLVFTGGTCLAKAHKNTYRMSEDVDIKLVPSSEILAQSHTRQRQFRRDIHQAILSAINSSDYFKLVGSVKKRNEGRYQQFLIEYPQFHGQFHSLRPYLQLDITESLLLTPTIEKPIGSLYAEVANLKHEISSFLCVSMESTACEKFVSLLRRTAASNRDRSRPDDETLIRHVYDLHLIEKSLPNLIELRGLVQQVIQTDVEQFGNQHEAFRDNTYQELQHGLQLLTEQAQYQKRYEKFIGPLVYHPSPASWDESIKTVLNMASIWLK